MRFSSSSIAIDLGQLGGGESPTASLIAKTASDLNDWDLSEHAGFRRILREGSDEAPNLAEIERVAHDNLVNASGVKFRNLVVLGTGGSSLGAETLIRALCSVASEQKFFFMDNNDPAFFSEHLELWLPEETLFYAVSKSGTTPETWAQILVVADWLKRKLGAAWKKHLVLCTDPVKGDFRAFAQASGLTCLDAPSRVGGRFSVLTPVGLFPAVWAGLDIRALLDGAREMATASGGDLAKDAAFHAAYRMVGLQNHRVTVAFSYSSHLSAFGRWFSQLWAESLGKEGKGFTPYPAVGTTDQHSQTQLYMEGPLDKVFAFHNVAKPAARLSLLPLEGSENLASLQILQQKSMADLFEAEFKATRDALAARGAKSLTITLSALDERSLGALLYFWEMTTACAGSLLHIDPFTQPGVEAGKILTKKYLSK
jgi:glucose-6-phosphate isomerase